ncbi:hypothetical protein J6590_005295 [Homalodisca vitripennis]|nr:hypothetical protein J6590_005295 [Homalodisca vitripennis]
MAGRAVFQLFGGRLKRKFEVTFDYGTRSGRCFQPISSLPCNCVIYTITRVTLLNLGKHFDEFTTIGCWSDGGWMGEGVQNVIESVRSSFRLTFNWIRDVGGNSQLTC